jgi:hypothetical protein
MKTINKFIAISLLFFSISVNAQSFVVSNDKENNLYLGVENPLIAIVEKMKCGSFILTTDNGKIREYENCRYIYNAERIGNATITIIKVKGNDTVNIGKSVFNVKEIPKPIAKIGGKNSGIIDKNLLLRSGGILTHYENFDFDLSVPIISYSLLIVKNNDSTYFKVVKGNKFTDELIQEFSRFKTNERVYFLDIIAKLNKGKYIELESLKFIIE